MTKIKPDPTLNTTAILQELIKIIQPLSHYLVQTQTTNLKNLKITQKAGGTVISLNGQPFDFLKKTGLFCNGLALQKEIIQILN